LLPTWSTNYDPYLFQNEVELIRSEQILGKVRERFNLRKNWGAPEKPGHVSAPGSLEFEVSPVRCTRFLDISASAAGRDEAAKIANAVVDAWQQYHQAVAQNGESKIVVELVAQATPPPRASFPNHYLGGASLLLGGLFIVGWWFAGARKPPASNVKGA